MSVGGLVLARCALVPVLALVIAGCAHGSHGATRSPAVASNPASASTASSPPSAGASVTTTADNIAATRRFSAWLLHAVPMPPGAREWRRSPTSHYRRGTLGIGPADDAFTRTTWWTVPATSEQLGRWLRAQARQSLKADSGSGSVQAEGVWETDQDFRSPSTSAHTTGWVNFAFTPYGVGVVVRVDTFTGARFARTVTVPETTTSVTIVRTERSDVPRRPTKTVSRTITDPRAVASLVSMVDVLPGAMTAPFVASCPFATGGSSYRMTFTGPGDTYVATLPTTTCWPNLQLSRNGVVVDPPLDPGRAFVRTADHYLR